MSPKIQVSHSIPDIQPSPASSQTRLFAILARNAPTAILFRRGPSRQIQLIKWNTIQDTFEEGQWFKGRVYERRCDLSPDGKKLIYFAANYKKPFFSWTAVSTIPYFSALLLWPKGDAWGGGGFFDTPFTISLNHREREMNVAEGFYLPKRLKVQPLGEYSGRGEDDPIYHMRLLRDGWKFVSGGKMQKNKRGAKIWIVFDPPIEYRKAFQINHQKTTSTFELSMQIKGIHEKDGSWYLVEYQICNLQSKQISSLQRLDWADWDTNGDLLLAKEGKLFRLKPNFRSGLVYDVTQAVQLADFSHHRFFEKIPSREALQW